MLNIIIHFQKEVTKLYGLIDGKYWLSYAQCAFVHADYAR